MTEIHIDDTIADALQNLSVDYFSENQSLAVRVDDAELDLTVVSVKSLASAVDNNVTGRAPFSVLLRSSPDVVLHQGMYRFNLDGIGELPLFLVPMGSDDLGQVYEMILS